MASSPSRGGADEGQGDDVPVLLGEVLLQAAGDLGGQPDRVGQLQGAGVGEGGLLAEAGPGDDAGFHAEAVPGPVGAGQAVDEEGDLGGLGVVARGGPEGVHERVAERLVGDGDQVPGGGVGHHEPAHLGLNGTGPMPGKTSAVSCAMAGSPPPFTDAWTSQSLEEVGQHREEPLGFLQVRQVAGLLEDLPARPGDLVVVRLDDGRRGLVVATADQQGWGCGSGAVRR